MKLSPPLLTVIAVMSSILFDGTMAQTQTTSSSSAYPCGDPSDAEPIFVADTSEDISSSGPVITSVQVGATCSGGECDFLIPKKIYYHVFALPPGSTPRHSITPHGFIRPVVSNGMLSYQYQEGLEELYSAGDSVEAGVQIFVPIDQLTSIRVTGVDQYLQVSIDPDLVAADDPFNITSMSLQIVVDGVDNTVTVKSPTMIVDLTATGVDLTAVMDVAARSSLRLSGVDHDVYVKSEQLTVYSDGVDVKVVVEGLVSDAVINGVDEDIQINGSGCDNVKLEGVDSKCEYTTESITVNSLPCTVQTTLAYDWWFNFFTTGAKVGLVIALVFVIVVSIVGIIYYCRTMRRKKHPTNTKTNIDDYQARSFENRALPPSNEGVAHATVVEAEVLEVTNEQPQAGLNVDVEAARSSTENGQYWKKYSS